MMTNLYPGAPAGSDEYRLFTLKNASDMTVTISERGAALRSWRTPDRYGRMADVMLADPDSPSSASQAPLWQGRHADGGVALHLALRGSADLRISYRLDDDGSLTIEYTAIAAVAAPLAANPHPSFNLNGGIADVGDHMLQIDADYYVEADTAGKPAGVAAVGGTPFDFRVPAPIGPRLSWPDSQLDRAGGFDHCFYVRSHFAGGQGELCEVARVLDPGSGRRLQMYTTEAALQFSVGRRAVGLEQRAAAGPYWRRHGFGLEANPRPELTSAAWPQVLLHPGQAYRQTTVYRLSLQV